MIEMLLAIILLQFDLCQNSSISSHSIEHKYTI